MADILNSHVLTLTADLSFLNTATNLLVTETRTNARSFYSFPIKIWPKKIISCLKSHIFFGVWKLVEAPHNCPTCQFLGLSFPPSPPLLCANCCCSTTIQCTLECTKQQWSKCTFLKDIKTAFHHFAFIIPDFLCLNLKSKIEFEAQNISRSAFNQSQLRSWLYTAQCSLWKTQCSVWNSMVSIQCSGFSFEC